MEEVKYTPAPWWVDEFPDGDVRVVADPLKGAPPPVCDGRTFVCKMYQNDARGIDAIANARLISAAPDLLEALQMSRAYIASRCGTPDYEDRFADQVLIEVHRLMDDAISKALGK